MPLLQLATEIKTSLTEAKREAAGLSVRHIHLTLYTRLIRIYNENKTVCNSLFLLGLWLAIGCIYGVVRERWTFITSLYYASAACSTGGLQGPTPDPSGVWFTAIYCIIGVPLYGVSDLLVFSSKLSTFGANPILSLRLKITVYFRSICKLVERLLLKTYERGNIDIGYYSF